MTQRIITLTALVMSFFVTTYAYGESVREIVTIQGAPPVQLEGVGIVTGLPGTGDKKPAALEMLRKYLGNNKYDFDAGQLAAGNIAFVRVSAEMPPFSRPGQKFSVKVSSLNDAKNLTGGELLASDLVGGDGELYARATGQVVVGSELLTRGIIPPGESSGATQIGVYPFGKVVSFDGKVRLNLKRPNITDAVAIARQINQTPSLNPYLEEATMFSSGEAKKPVAFAVDPGQVLVTIPPEHRYEQSRYLSQILNVQVAVDRPARIVVNRAKNTIVVTGDIQVRNAVVSLKDKTVTVQPETDTRPARYTLENDTPRSLIELEGPGTYADLQGLIDTLNATGLKTEEIITIFEELRAAGALNAEFVGQ